MFEEENENEEQKDVVKPDHRATILQPGLGRMPIGGYPGRTRCGRG
jgi:hypothetical protein